MQTLNEAQQGMRDSAELGPARLCIAAQPTIARILFGSLGHALKERYPLIQVRFIEGLASQVVGGLSDGEVDIAMLYLPARWVVGGDANHSSTERGFGTNG